MSIPRVIMSFASFRDLMENMACAFVWFVPQLAGFLSHFALMIEPLERPFPPRSLRNVHPDGF